MDLNQPITSTKNNFGLTSLIGGILQVIFGFSLSFVGIALFAITFSAGIKSLSSEKINSSRIIYAKIGMVLSLLMIVLFFVFDFRGLLMPFMDTLL